MDVIKNVFGNLPLDKLTSTGVLVISILIIIMVLFVTINKKKKDKLEIEDKNSTIEKARVGVIKKSQNEKSVKIKLEKSNIKDSDIGCIEDDR
ncbi:hypothetical protein [Clostridium beijerinckii]|uniref:hypothetical protein n=1 Tax=Clostridium beijerinckii TaxID=1520 RepID=UPI00080A7527|nr:hypothetical protein [Clostridium beijerinckii]OCB00427.1 hypothetical protein BGS1_15925 [Clostridium beijerinckii]